MRSSPNAQLVPEVAHSRQFQKAPNRLEIAHIGNNEIVLLTEFSRIG